MAEFLSQDWFGALASRLAAVTVGAPGETGLRLGQVITGAPDGGTVSYTITLGSGVPGAVVRGSVADAHVVLVESYDSARSIVEGAPPATLLAEGRIKVRGDVNVLLRSSAELAALSAALAVLT